MDFGDVLTRAWKIIWKLKVLWIFGILASCGFANGRSGNVGTSFLGSPPPQLERYFEQFVDIPEGLIIAVIGVLILVFLFINIPAIFLGTIGRIGLIQGTQQADQGVERLVLGELFSSSLPYFLRVFGFNLIIGIAAFLAIVALVLLIIMLSIVTLGLGALCMIPFICFLVPLFWLVGVIVEQSNIAIVVEDIGIFEGLQRGWEVVKANLGVVVVMALILNLGISFVVGFVIGLPFVLVAIPSIIGALAGTEQAFGGGLILPVISFAVYLPIMILLGGILRAYISSAWTLTYLRLTGKSVTPESVPVTI